jgi:hypothetical protein
MVINPLLFALTEPNLRLPYPAPGISTKTEKKQPKAASLINIYLSYGRDIINLSYLKNAYLPCSIITPFTGSEPR